MRPLTLADIAKADAILRSEGVSPTLIPYKRLIHLILTSGAGIAALFEDIPESPPRRALAFGVTVFTPAAFSNWARPIAACNRAQEIVEQMNAGGVRPLGRNSLPAENSGQGVTLLAYGGRAEGALRTGEGLELGELQSRAFFLSHSGYNFQDMLWLTCSEEHLHYLNSAGASVIGTSGGSPPYLAGISENEAPAVRGSLLSMLFNYQRPTLFLSTSQRQLVILALDGLTDSEAAVTLQITLPAVKKRWATLFDQVACKAPALLPEAISNGRRGPEKRGILLNYLRNHPEELRSHTDPGITHL